MFYPFWKIFHTSSAIDVQQAAGPLQDCEVREMRRERGGIERDIPVYIHLTAIIKTCIVLASIFTL